MEQIEQLITSYYDAILRREPTPADIRLWTTAINRDDPDGGINFMADALLAQADDVLSIMRIYQVVLGRAPDSDGLTYWVEVFRGIREANPDMSYQDALIATIPAWQTSPEFVSNYGSNLSDREYVQALYVNVLNRAPDEEGFNFWLNELETGVRTRDQLVIAFSESPEFKDAVDPEARAILVYDAQTSSEHDGDNPDHTVPGNNPYGGELQNEAPIDIQISDAVAVDENATNGTVVSDSRLTAVDRDAGDSFTWTLIDDADGAFALDDATALRPNIVVADANRLDHETNATMTVTVRAIDSRGNTYDEIIEININDSNELPILLTSGEDDLDGTAANDIFEAPVVQNPGAGGVSNSLSSADSIDGGAGNDRFHAEISQEFLGNSGFAFTDIQPTVANVEEFDIEALDFDGDFPRFTTVTLDAKDISGHDEIGSYRSDGDLVIENLTTLGSDGETRRPTAEITITMDHTDNSNTDNDASDLTVYFDDNYLIRDQTTEIDPSTAVFRLLDQDAELWAIRLTPGNEERTGRTVEQWRLTEDWQQYATDRDLNPATDVPERLQNIDVYGIFFTLNGERVTIDINGNPPTPFSGSHMEFLTALKERLPEGVDLVLRPGLNTTGLEDGLLSNPIPEFALIADDGGAIDNVGFVQPPNQVGNFNVYGRIDPATPPNPVITTHPISVDIDLFKVGRGGDGGALIVGAKSQEAGIEVFNVDVKGTGGPIGETRDQSSNLESIKSTGDALRTINIETHQDYREGGSEYVAGSFADLTIRDGEPSGDLTTINANGFLGDLTMGSEKDFVNADTIKAMGGGNVTIDHTISEDGEFAIMTGDGGDKINQTLKFDAGRFGDGTVSISTGAGDDEITLGFETSTLGAIIPLSLNGPGTVIVDAGAGNDTISLNGSLNETVVLTGDNFGGDTVNGFETGNDPGTGFDFLDFTSYLTSREDPPGEDAERPIGVSLDFNEDNTLTNAVAANEVAIVRMTADEADGETFAALSAESVAALFNTTGGNAFGGDNTYGNLTNDNFAVRADYVGNDLVGNAKAILMVENAADVGMNKVFELTWSGRAGSGDDVEVAELGSLDFANTALTGLEEENLVGTSQYDGIA